MEYKAFGQNMTLREWSLRLDIKSKTLWARLNSGYTSEEAFTREFKRHPNKRDEEKTVFIQCLNCKEEFIIPKCREWREKCCSSKCKKEYRDNKNSESKALRERSCKNCKRTFYPRKSQIDNGVGFFCSVLCSINNGTLVSGQTSQSVKKTQSKLAAMRVEGILVHSKGINSPRWLGGKKAAIQRRLDSGKYTEYTRKWRKKNPDKVREQNQTRKGRKIGRLERGTVSFKGLMQKWKCAICETCVKNKYHIDHIIPLAKGGKHEKHNIQILCPHCNLTKSSKDPIEHMQSLGRLL